jgi:hypothetical protein
MEAFQPKPDDPALELVGNKTPITLKNIKFSEWASEETHCFQATIYMDGERAMKVSNEGHGGPNQYYHTNGQSSEEFKRQFERAIIIGENYIKDSREEGWQEWISKLAGTSELLDWLVSDLLNEHLTLKEMRTKMRTKTIFYDKKLKKVFHHDHKPTPENLSYLKRNSRSGVLFFNDIPEAEAYYYWRKI